MQYSLLNYKQSKYSKQYLDSVYILSNGDTEHTYGCVPNGGIGISVIVKGEGHTLVDNTWIKQPPVSIYGLIDKIQFHKMSIGYREINIGFEPHFLQLFLKDSMSCLLKRQSTDLNYLHKKEDVDYLSERLQNAKNDQEILLCIEGFLEQHLLQEKVDGRILHALDLMQNTPIYKVEDVCNLMKVSATYLRTLFRERVGISPKDMMKIKRIKSALDTRQYNEESLTRLAYSLNYYDQSHFIHEFKDAVGVTPKNYFNNKKLTFDFYNFQRWDMDSFDELNLPK